MPEDHVLERYNIKFGVNEFCWEPDDPGDFDMSEENRALVAHTFAEVIPEWLRIVPAFHCFQVSDWSANDPREGRFAGYAHRNSIYLEKWYLEERLAVNQSSWSFKHLLIQEIGHFVWREAIPAEEQQSFTDLAWESYLLTGKKTTRIGIGTASGPRRRDGCFVRDYAKTNPNEEFLRRR